MSKYNIIIDTIEPLKKSLSIKIEGWYVDENEELKIIRERRAFLPGQIDDVNTWLDEFAPNTDKTDTLNVLNAMWTQEIIDAYNKLLEENE